MGLFCSDKEEDIRKQALNLIRRELTSSFSMNGFDREIPAPAQAYAKIAVKEAIRGDAILDRIAKFTTEELVESIVRERMSERIDTILREEMIESIVAKINKYQVK